VNAGREPDASRTHELGPGDDGAHLDDRPDRP
jgi:hypothetical protein